MPKATSSRVAQMKSKAHQQRVALGDMRVADLAQRVKRPHWVSHLVAHFDFDKFGLLWLSHRDGHYYIIDGQHRYFALIEWLDGDDWEVIEVETCMVVTGLSMADEAELFLDLNNRLNLAAYDKFNISLTAGRPEQTDINRIIRSNGFSISNDRETGISAVRTLEIVYGRDGANDLGRTVRLIGNSYGMAGFRADVIDGLGRLCHRYNGQLDEGKAIKQLSSMRGGVSGLLNNAYTIREKLGQPLRDCIAAAAVERINQAPGTKLDKWWQAG